jgi:type I restriction enzyme R subunit
MSTYTEDHLVEQPAIQLMQHELGWDVVNCYDEWNGGVSNQGRDGKREVVLVSRLRPALRRLNPDLPVEAIEGAVEEICRDRTALSLAEANREIDKLLKQGVKVSFPDQEHGGQVIDHRPRLRGNGGLSAGFERGSLINRKRKASHKALKFKEFLFKKKTFV